MEELITNVIREAKTNLEFAKQLLDSQLKQRQLPWSVEMFEDIQIFADSVFTEFTSRSKTEKTEMINELEEYISDEEP